MSDHATGFNFTFATFADENPEETLEFLRNAQIHAWEQARRYPAEKTAERRRYEAHISECFAKLRKQLDESKHEALCKQLRQYEDEFSPLTTMLRR